MWCAGERVCIWDVSLGTGVSGQEGVRQENCVKGPVGLCAGGDGPSCVGSYDSQFSRATIPMLKPLTLRCQPLGGEIWSPRPCVSALLRAPWLSVLPSLCFMGPHCVFKRKAPHGRGAVCRSFHAAPSV